MKLNLLSQSVFQIPAMPAPAGWRGNRRMLVITACLVILSSIGCAAQKIVEQPVWTHYHRAATVSLPAQYKSYAVNYDFGNLPITTAEPPAIQNLILKKEQGDLALHITEKSLHFTPGDLQTTRKLLSRVDLFYYAVNYNVDCHYELVDAKQNTVLASFKLPSGKASSKQFVNQMDLESYMKSQYLSDLSQDLLSILQKQIDYSLSDHTWVAKLTLATIEGDTQECQEINKGVQDLSVALQEPVPGPEKIRPIVAVWEALLAQVDWGSRKAILNKRVGNTLIKNLNAAYLMLEDYPALRQKMKLFDEHNRGLFDALMPSFYLDATFTGPTRDTYTTSLTRNNVAGAYYSVDYSAIAVETTGN